jgi:flagellar biosynthesis protein FlhB
MSGDKTEEPTQRKLEDARRQGQVPQRKSVHEVIVLTTGVMLVMAIWPGVARLLGKVFDVAFQGASGTLAEANSRMVDLGKQAAILNLSIALSLGAVTLLACLLLSRFNFAPAALTPKFEKLNPVNGLKAIFSIGTVYNFVRLLVFFVSSGLILYLMVASHLRDVIHASLCGTACLADLFPGIFKTTVVIILLVLAILAAIDFKVQTAIFRKQNRMSKDDVKREYKSAEGDPHIKGARHQIAHEDATLPSLKDVTHVVYSSKALVALVYHEGYRPFVVLKADGSNVPRLLQRFRRAGTPCVNLPGIAISFHAMGIVGTYMDLRAANGIIQIQRAAGQT